MSSANRKSQFGIRFPLVSPNENSASLVNKYSPKIPLGQFLNSLSYWILPNLKQKSLRSAEKLLIGLGEVRVTGCRKNDQIKLPSKEGPDTEEKNYNETEKGK